MSATLFDKRAMVFDRFVYPEKDVQDFIKDITEVELWEYCGICKSFICNVKGHRKIRLANINRIRAEAGKNLT